MRKRDQIRIAKDEYEWATINLQKVQKTVRYWKRELEQAKAAKFETKREWKALLRQ